MKTTWRFDRTCIILAAAILLAPSAVRVVSGGGGAKGVMTFQRSVDIEGLGPFGRITLQDKGTDQSFDLDVRELPGDNWGLFLGLENGFDTNVALFIAALDRQSNGRLQLGYRSSNGDAPIQLQVCITDGVITNCTTDLEDLTGLFMFVASPSGSTNIVCDTTNLVGCTTNIEDCVTNIVEGVTNVTDCVTNLVDCTTNCVTNVIVGAVLFAEVPLLSPSSSAFNFAGKVPLMLPGVPPNPDASGTIAAKFSATQGRSLLDIRAKSLYGGQSYSLWLSTNAGGAVVTNVGPLTMKNTKGTFRRDTKRGETLPLLSSTVTNLSGFNVEIRDGFDDVHLEGTIP